MRIKLDLYELGDLASEIGATVQSRMTMDSYGPVSELFINPWILTDVDRKEGNVQVEFFAILRRPEE